MMEQSRSIDRAALVVVGAVFFALGFYLGLLVAALLVGEDTFNRSLPNPWRALVFIPIVIAVGSYRWWEGRHA